MTDLPPLIRSDRVVARTNELVTTGLDTLGILLLAGAAFLGVWRPDRLALGVLAAGVVVLMLSTLVQARQRPRVAKVPPGAHPHRAPAPGPEDPGTIHVKG